MTLLKGLNGWFSEQLSIISSLYNLGLSRSILAFGTLLTLLGNDTKLLFFNISGPAINIKKDSISLFYLLGPEHIEVGRFFCIITLIIVIAGVWPRYTSIMHWWVSYSLFNSVQVLDGGDQITNILTFLLMPIFILSSKKTHWNHEIITNNNHKIIVYFFLSLARFQICVLYLEAATAKFLINEWKDGTAVYYFLSNKAFGSADFFVDFLNYLVSIPIIVVIMTWGTIVIELLLCASFFMSKKYWNIFFWVGFSFHFAIFLILGLASFSTAMIGALVIYLMPFKQTELLWKHSLR